MKSFRNRIALDPSVKANLLLKQNIDTLLTRRHQTRRDLAQWCHRSESWLSQIFTKPEREIPLKYLDRMADFFGLSVYQLFQPGISPLTERRKGLDRRSGRDRRLSAMNTQVRESVSATIAALTPEDVADLIRLKALTEASRVALRTEVSALARSELHAGVRRRGRPAAGTVAGAATTPAARDGRAPRTRTSDG